MRRGPPKSLALKLLSPALLAGFSALPAHSYDGPRIRHVILIGIDGLRPDLVTPKLAPIMAGLKARGAWASEAHTVNPSKTLPNFASMMTGQPPSVHGLKGNDFATLRHLISGGHAPTFLDVARKQKLDGKAIYSAAFLGEIPNFQETRGFIRKKLAHRALRRIFGRTAVLVDGTPDENAALSRLVALRAARSIRDQMPDITFLYFKDLDALGHAFGWASKEQEHALSGVDQAVGIVVKAVEDAGQKDNTLIIIASDHGGGAVDPAHEGTPAEDGDRKGHDFPGPLNFTATWLASGPGIKAGYVISHKTSVMDTAPTILFALGLHSPLNWEGKPLAEIFEAAAGNVAWIGPGLDLASVRMNDAASGILHELGH